MRYFLVLLLVGCFQSAPAQQKFYDITGVWLTEDREAHVEILKVNGIYQGKISWLKDPYDKKGMPWKDDKNPDVKRRNQTIHGLTILWDFVLNKSSNEYEDGNVYDSRDGKTYSGKLWLEGKDVLKMRGYVGISLFGKTETWTRVFNP